MDLTLSHHVVCQASILSVLNLVLTEIEPHSVCIFTNNSNKHDISMFDMNLEIPSIVINCEDARFIETFKNGIKLGCNVIFDFHEIIDTFSLFNHTTIIEDIPETLLLTMDLENSLQEKSIKIYYFWESVNLFNKYFVDNQSLLFEKSFFHNYEMLNLQGRELRVSLVVYTPFSHAKFNGEQELDVDGTDIYLVKEFCKKHNCTISYNFVYEGDVYGIIYDNFTGFGIFGATGSRRTHISIGAPYMTIFLFPYTILSLPTQQSKIINLVPIPKPLSYTKTPLLPFPFQIWGLVCLTYLIGIITVFFVQKLSFSKTTQRNETKSIIGNAIFTIIRISVFQSMVLKKTTGIHALIVLILLFFSLILGTLYGGGFASVLTVTRYEKPISTVAELVESNYQWKGITIAYLYPIELTQDPFLRKYIDNFIVVPLTEIKNQDHKTSIFLTELTQNRAVCNLDNMMDHISAQNYMVAKEELTGQYTTVIAHKTWPFMEYMNRIIYAVTESGIREYWEFKVINNVMDYSIQRIVDENNRFMDKNNGPVPISVDHIIGALIALGVGYVVSILAFILEIISFYLKK
uniref:CSON003528 protein n=1 Tax=Culicoides sonorensis TaxID=179676 RepID=A0A336MLL3_CULSO